MKASLPKLVFIGIFFLFLWPLPARATNSSSVVVNEVMWMGTSASSYDEWIELYNLSSLGVSLDGWTLRGVGTSEIELTGTIAAGGYFLLERGAEDTVLDIVADQIYWGALSNDGEALELRDADGNLIDAVDAASGWFAGDHSAKASMERIDPVASGNEPANWCTNNGSLMNGQDANGAGFLGTARSQNSCYSITPTPTLIPTLTPTPTAGEEKNPALEDSSEPGSGESPVVTPTPYSTQIYLSEFLPNPESGGQEWVELYNAGNTQADLSGWQIDDIEGGSTAYTVGEGAEIAAQSYAVFYFSSAKLNNTGDTVRLLNPSGLIHDAVSFGSPTKGWSWAKAPDGGWVETTTATPGSVNAITTPTPTPTPTATLTPTPVLEDSATNSSIYRNIELGEVRGLELKTRVEFKGVITAPPEILGSDVIYVQAGGVGIRVVLADLNYADLALGDQVRVRGELRQAYQEFYVKDLGETVVRLAAGDPFLPTQIKTGGVGEENEGRLVWVLGQVVQTRGSTFYLDDGSGRVKVYIKGSTQIDKPRMRVGDYAKVIGIVSQYNDSYRLLPRFQDDLEVAEDPGRLLRPEGGDVLGVSLLPETAIGPVGIAPMCLSPVVVFSDSDRNPRGDGWPWIDRFKGLWYWATVLLKYFAFSGYY